MFKKLVSEAATRGDLRESDDKPSSRPALGRDLEFVKKLQEEEDAHRYHAAKERHHHSMEIEARYYGRQPGMVGAVHNMSGQFHAKAFDAHRKAAHLIRFGFNDEYKKAKEEADQASEAADRHKYS